MVRATPAKSWSPRGGMLCRSLDIHITGFHCLDGRHGCFIFSNHLVSSPSSFGQDDWIMRSNHVCHQDNELHLCGCQNSYTTCLHGVRKHSVKHIVKPCTPMLVQSCSLQVLLLKTWQHSMCPGRFCCVTRLQGKNKWVCGMPLARWGLSAPSTSGSGSGMGQGQWSQGWLDSV